MPLETQIKRNGRARRIRWGGFHVAAMVYAASVDSGESPFDDLDSVKTQIQEFMEDGGFVPITPKDAFQLVSYPVIACTPLNSGDYVLKNEYRFKDVTDGEEFILKPGDVLSAWRSH